MDGFLDSRPAGWIRLRDVVRKSGDEILNVLCSAFLIGSDCKKKNDHTTRQSTRAMQAFGASCATEP